MRIFKQGQQQLPWQSSALDLAEKLKDGSITLEALAESCLARIAEREGLLKAWSWHDPDLVRKQVRVLERAAGNLPLFGLPIGIKDIIETADMPTAYGSAIYQGHRPAHDAEVVVRLRAAGALIVGKTATTEFAFAQPAPTVNPHNRAHTPGGSSSGSAAAVADGMVPLALGSQTGGSTIRPAAYCGIVGFKPTYGAISMVGIKPLAPSMDTVGIHARCVGDVALVFPVLCGRRPQASQTRAAPQARIAYFPGPYSNEADADAWRALDAAREALRAAGFLVEPLALPSAEFQDLSEANRIIMAYEGAMSLTQEYELHRESLGKLTAGLVDTGRNTSRPDYENALKLAARCRQTLSGALGESDILMTFSAPGEAPLLSEGTGNSIFNRAWSTTGVPCITLPFGHGTRAGLPLGIQFVAGAGHDFSLLASASRIEQLFKSFG